MKKTNQLLLLFCLGLMELTAQTEPQILVQPYLQDAEPNSIVIMWETTSGEESTVEWGTTEKLGKKTSGKAEDINFSESRVHIVKLEGLKRFTEYYYRVKPVRPNRIYINSGPHPFQVTRNRSTLLP